MTSINVNNLYKTYRKEYSSWRDDKSLQEAKRQEYLKKHPEAIKDYDLQRAKILLHTVDIMDKSVSLNSDHTNTVIESITSFGLGYAAMIGALFGIVFQKLGGDKLVNKIIEKQPKYKNSISTAITIIGGILGVVTAYPAYAFFSNVDSKIDRKKRFDTMEKELQDPKIFVVLNSEQKKEFNENLEKIKSSNQAKNKSSIIKKNVTNLKTTMHEILNYNDEQNNFKNKYKEKSSLYENNLTEKEIKDAKKDKVLLCVLIKEINTKAQSYEEKIQKITDNLITISFALGSLFSLGFERIAKKLKLKRTSVPAGIGVAMMLLSTIFATWSQKRASHVGRFKAKQELMENPERLVYISQKKTSSIDEEEIEINPHKKISTWQFMKNFFKHNKEYETWKKTPSLTGSDLSQAMENIDISEEQLQDGKRLKTNMFKTFYKVESNTQNYSSKIDLLKESINYPIMLLLGATGSLLSMKHLIKLRHAKNTNEIFKESAKFIGTISIFTLPSLLINSHFAKVKKMGARISDMLTMKDLEDYRFFADYSRFEEAE